MIPPTATLHRVQTRTPEPAGADLRVRRALEAADWSVSALPPSAILVIRQLEAPPRALDGPDRWSVALAATLESVAGRAVRPAHGQHSDEAVWFADPAELLAVALTRTRPDAWWWRRLVPGLDLPTQVGQALLRHVEHVPTALALLHRQGRLDVALHSLDAPLAAALLQQLIARFGLSALGQALAEPGAVLDPTTSAPPLPPFAAWTPHLPSSLPAIVRLLAGVALGVERAAWQTQQVDFATATVRWLRHETRRHIGVTSIIVDNVAPQHRATPAPTDTPAAAAHPALAQSPGRAAATPATARTAGPVERRSPSDTDAPAAPGPQTGAPGRPGAPAATPHANRSPIAATIVSDTNKPVTTVTAHSAPMEPAPPSTTVEAPPPAPVQGPPPIATPDPSPWPLTPPPSTDPALDLPELPEPIATRLGGVFYLVNLGLYLGLYNDFSAPLDPGLDLPFWDWVELVARELHPKADPNDPLWALLRRLSGRPEDREAGAGWRPPERWEVPPAWLRPLRGRGPWRDARPYDGTLTTWVALLGDYLRARLRAALPERDPAAMFKQGALVLLSSGRLEIVFALDTHPVDIRLAGLDRDPGWIPAAGRDIRFRYA